MAKRIRDLKNGGVTELGTSLKVTVHMTAWPGCELTPDEVAAELAYTLDAEWSVPKVSIDCVEWDKT